MTIEEVINKIKGYDTHLNDLKVRNAYTIACRVHSSQKRLSGDPFINHALEVAGILTDLKLDSDAVCTGLLHDTLEDSILTFEELRAETGDEIANLVEGVTKLSFKINPEKEIRQAENFRKILLAMAKDIRVIIIKLADRLHNMRTLQFLSDDKRKENALETLEIFAPLANRLGIGKIRWELEDLAMKYLYPSEYEEISNKVAARRVEREKIVEDMKRILEEKLKEQNIKVIISGRAKHFHSIYQKMKRLNKSFEEIYDIIAARIITDSVSECYAVLGIVHSLWTPIPGQFDDYIAMPKSNMYQSLHTTVVGPMGEPLEIQIRTKEMHENAEYGISAHWYYKEGGPRDKAIEDKIKWLRHLLEWLNLVKDSREFMDSLKMDLFSDEVFVFTPKGDVIELPWGSSTVDFAFAVHSSLGEHCVSAKVNNKMVPLKTQLKTGDIVEIIVSPNHHPNADWLKFVKTSKAKNKIRHLIRGADTFNYNKT